MNMLLQKLKSTYHKYPLITSLSVLILFGATLTFATPPTSPYTAGETLDPTCAPGDANCTVTIIPVQTGNSGKYLTTDGTTASWATVSGSSPISLGTSGNTLYTSGLGAGEGDTLAGNNIFLGDSAGDGATSVSYSTFLGSLSGELATNAAYSNFIGGSSGNSATNASRSNFIGNEAGYGATNAANSIFLGLSAGKLDTVDNTQNGTDDSSILIGNYTNTGGFSNSILLGSGVSGVPIANTAANQFMLADTITNVRWSGVEYTLPSVQGTSGQVLRNDGAGILTWVANGLTSLNALTGATQTFAVSTSGTNFAISSSGTTHTFAIPNASAGVTRGLLTSANWTTFNNKESALTFSVPLSRSVNTISITQSDTGTDGYLSSTDWNTFNNKVSSQWLNSGSDIYFSTGNVGIGMTPTVALSVNGSILQTGATSCSLDADTDGKIICTVSDQKLKKDITDMSYGLSHVMQLHPVEYNFIDTKYGSGPQIGFIAQELEQIIPEVVTDGPDYKSVNYALLTSVLTKAVQELNLTLTAIDTFAFEDIGGFAERLRQFFESATNGIRTIVTGKVQTKELCLEDVCVTKAQLQQLLNQTQQSSSGGESNNPPVSEPDDTPVDMPTESGEEVVQTPSEDIPETESQQETQPVPETIPPESPTETPAE